MHVPACHILDLGEDRSWEWPEGVKREYRVSGALDSRMEGEVTVWTVGAKGGAERRGGEAGRSGLLWRVAAIAQRFSE